MRPRAALPPLLLLVLAGPAPAQGRDPEPPRGGFPVARRLDRRVELSDEYVTVADAFYPDATAGSFGWPLVVFTHGLGGSRHDAGGEAHRLATLGYFVLTYDVRGQGEARVRNPTKGSRLWALDEWIDLAEMIEWAIADFRIVDRERIAVYGDSQGGAHAWAAAAYSDRRLPANPRRLAPFPAIACVVPRFFGPSMVDAVVRHGTSFHWHAAGLAYAASNPLVRLDATYRADLARHLDQGDPGALAAYLKGVPGKDFVAQLETTRVPILTIQAWQDPWTDPGDVLAVLDKLPAATPRRMCLSTGLHGTPINARESRRQLVLTELWLRRFLKGTVEPLEHGPPVVAAAMPAGVTAYADPQSLWRYRAEAAWPPADAVLHRFHVRSGARLRSTAPAFWEESQSVQHRVETGFDARGYFAAGGRPKDVLAKIPLQRLTYETDPLTHDAELAGTPVVSILVRPTRASFMLAARLVAVSPLGKARVLTSGARAVHLASVPPEHRFEFPLDPLACVVPARYRVRVEVSNHHLVDPRNGDSFGHLPLFTSFGLGLQHRPESPSWIDLPIREHVRADLATASDRISVTEPGRQSFEIRSASRWSDASYTVLASLTGQGPPAVLPGGARLYLTLDPLTDVFLRWANNAILPNFIGKLDGRGRARLELNLDVIKPLPLALVGSSLHLAPLIEHPLRGITAGAPVRLLLQ